MIDAEVRSEEKFSRISIAYEGKEEGKLVCSSVDTIIAKHTIQPETYTCNVSSGKEVLVIEYEVEDNREVGDIFEDIMRSLNIDKCID